MNGIAFLKIMKGVQKVPGDTLSAEAGLDEIDLLDPTGFACDEYDMKIPALKSSAVYADSPLSDGRTLISGALGNVTETIRTQLTAGTIIQLAAMLSKLGRFKQDCNDFWDTFGQIEPVYIKHQVIGEPGPRYALLYDIDVDVDTPLVPNEPKRTVTLVIEREPFWRGLAPGDNPKKWVTVDVNHQTWSASNSNLIGGSGTIPTGDLVDQQITNKLEFSTDTTIMTRNYVDIPAASIPGDLPALLCVTVQQTLVDNSPTVYMGRVSKPLSLPNRGGGSALPHYNDLPAAMATMSIADTTLQSDANGLNYPPVAAALRVARISFATSAALVLRIHWHANVHRSYAVLRGRYMLFLRARQNAGASGNTSIRIDIEDGGGVGTPTPYYISPLITPIVSASVALHYVGVVDIPMQDRTMVGARGTGMYAANAANYGSQFIVKLYASRATGVATLDIFDLLFIPIDEGMALIKPTETMSGLGQNVIFDNTGYFSHGVPGDVGFARFSGGFTTLDEIMVTEFQSQGMSLRPNVDNRIYFLLQRQDDLTVLPGNVAYVGINIVPRWSGLRDV